MTKKILSILIFATIVLAQVHVAMAQDRPLARTNINGVVRDSLTQEPLSFVAIFLKGSDKVALNE